MVKEQYFQDSATSAKAAAKAMADGLVAALSARGTATLAVSGGRTPRRVLPLLAAYDLDWSAVTITLIDDRWVPQDHEDSNERLVRETLLQGPAAQARFVGLKTPGDDPLAGRDACEHRLAGVRFPLDVAYLGFGPDGHIASLFPDHQGWQDASGRCVGVPPLPGRVARISLSATALLDCRLMVVMYDGLEKHTVYQRARTPGPVQDLPLRLVLCQDRVPVQVFRS